MLTYDDGTGSALYAAGEFTEANGAPAAHVARWNGSSWSALGSGLDGNANVLCLWDDGTGPALIVGGSFDHAGGVDAGHIAKWNGSSWSDIGGAAFDGRVEALTVYDDQQGGGPRLIAAGLFAHINGVPFAHIAGFNGLNWTAYGSGTDGEILSLCAYDAGSGARLYAGGYFTHVGGASARGIASWNGTAWQALGSGAGNGVTNYVDALVVWNDGSGAKLIVGGGFYQAGGITAPNLAKWDGTRLGRRRRGLTGSRSGFGLLCRCR